MIIKCRYCSKEFDSPGRRNQHEKDAHLKPAAKPDPARDKRMAEIWRLAEISSPLR